jgi:hypothetical protein
MVKNAELYTNIFIPQEQKSCLKTRVYGEELKLIAQKNLYRSMEHFNRTTETFIFPRITYLIKYTGYQTTNNYVTYTDPNIRTYTSNIPVQSHLSTFVVSSSDVNLIAMINDIRALTSIYFVLITGQGHQK